MQNLQDLYDHYINSKPSRGKVKAASSMLIHVCKAMDLVSPEVITAEYYKEIPRAINKYYYSANNLAVQDKSILAEMIGRYGPRDGWERTFKILLQDEDENLRQFTLHSLEFSCDKIPDIVVNYIEEYKDHPDVLLRDVAAHLTGNLLCLDENDSIREKLSKWCGKESQSFLDEIMTSLKTSISNPSQTKDQKQCEVAYKWLKETFKSS